ncbi:hypothetical protein IC229_22765 [Spirosoma sp. BT702]|uniref:Uncharacterized protein n=1 Tax=Spirosoma profusum TaxID=2771354 RepID=A0A927ATG9_9BACT|nr:hypothetical protein [Spirosoma profusum]MBD2703485.1 hypothetical protein [Spirosoma profusum]
MTTGLIFSSKRPIVYWNLRRQVIAEFREELRGTAGWKREWIRWKRGMALEIRYNELLFAEKKGRVPTHSH